MKANICGKNTKPAHNSSYFTVLTSFWLIHKNAMRSILKRDFIQKFEFSTKLLKLVNPKRLKRLQRVAS